MWIKSNRRPFSLATRLTFFISLTTIAAFAVFSWILIHSVEMHFEEQDLSELKQLSTTLSRIVSKEDEPEKIRIDKLLNAIINHSNTFIYLENDKKEVISQSENGLDFKQVIASPLFHNSVNTDDIIVWHDPMPTGSTHDSNDMEQTSYRIIAFPIRTLVDGKPTTYTLLIALSIDFHLHYIQQLKYKLIMTAFVISLVIIFIVLLAVYQGHAPLRSVSRKIQSITSDNLHVRLLPTDVPIELEQFVMSFNHMIERIEDVFTRQSHFSADIAHEIRTPITNLVTQTEIALSQPRSVNEYEDVLYSNLEEFNRMAKMVSDMLFLAQADNNLLVPERVSINLKTEIIKVFDFFEAWAEEREVSLKFVGSPLSVNGDPLMLRRAISNLLSNAIRYTPAGKSVTVSVTDNLDNIQLVVENPGVPIPAEHLSRLFDRFYRVDPSRQRKGDGSGIGLAIVKSIIRAHQGKISVTSDAISTKFIILLPKE
ncbi:Cu(+)/Ag(+) sensor histidine kinase [Yersinia pekkanenii]|uniref:Sensor protein n=1 Tax=Yersinia pekkanenii TaxID=1288385 RepID=A0A0T9Q1B0_9GAMM|nr:Cu(+)/Ag(+) sensor histidine kinase [Yersinia pekkanenii]CNH91390.1 putative two-component system sensor protein [Yersinia pekkanenii]CRY67743.1 putative two-component system sensor protein [Yersinia pekkanenii]